MSAGLMLGSAIGRLPDCGEQPPSGLQQCGEVMRLGKAVVDRAALGAAGDQAAVLGDGDGGGDGGQGAAEVGGQVGDALFAMLEGEQDGQPGGLGQGAEQRDGGQSSPSSSSDGSGSRAWVYKVA